MKTTVHTDKAPAAIGPYSQAIAVNGFLYTSGQIALNPETGELPVRKISSNRPSLKVLKASDEELEAHQKKLDSLKGALWNREA